MDWRPKPDGTTCQPAVESWSHSLLSFLAIFWSVHAICKACSSIHEIIPFDTHLCTPTCPGIQSKNTQVFIVCEKKVAQVYQSHSNFSMNTYKHMPKKRRYGLDLTIPLVGRKIRCNMPQSDDSNFDLTWSKCPHFHGVILAQSLLWMPVQMQKFTKYHSGMQCAYNRTSFSVSDVQSLTHLVMSKVIK